MSTATVQFRIATPEDLPALVPLMRGYYRDDGLEFDPQASPVVMARLLAEPQWGRVWLIELRDTAIGYLALCLGFSLEFGGNDAFVDELYLEPEFRNRGYGREALEFAAAQAAKLGVRALHLEVDRSNAAAVHLYESLRFRRRERYFLMTRQLR